MRRSRMDIYWDILNFLLKEPKRSTHVIYNCNMSWTGFQEMSTILKQMNLVHEITSPRGGRLFCITDKGRKAAEFNKKATKLMMIDGIYIQQS